MKLIMVPWGAAVSAVIGGENDPMYGNSVTDSRQSALIVML